MGTEKRREKKKKNKKGKKKKTKNVKVYENFRSGSICSDIMLGLENGEKQYEREADSNQRTNPTSHYQLVFIVI